MQPFLVKHYNIVSNLFLTYGINSVSMDDIAITAHTSKKTIYKEYRCKEELVQEFFISDHLQFKQRINLLGKSNANAVAQTIQLYFLVHKKVMLANPSVLFDLKKYYPNLFNEIIVLHKETITDSFFSVLMQGQKEDLFLQNIDPDSIANFITFLFESYIYNRLIVISEEWILNPYNLFEYHFRGICTPIGADKWEIEKQKLLNGH